MENGRSKVVTVCADIRVVMVWLIRIQMGKRWNCVWVGIMKINLRLRRRQSTVPVCPSETWVTDRSTVR